MHRHRQKQSRLRRWSQARRRPRARLRSRATQARRQPRQAQAKRRLWYRRGVPPKRTAEEPAPVLHQTATVLRQTRPSWLQRQELIQERPPVRAAAMGEEALAALQPAQALLHLTLEPGEGWRAVGC